MNHNFYINKHSILYCIVLNNDILHKRTYYGIINKRIIMNHNLHINEYSIVLNNNR